MIDTGSRHSNRRRTADKNATDSGPQQNPLGRQRTGSQSGELVSSMSFYYPGRLIAEAFGELDTVYDIAGRESATAQREPDACHWLLLWGNSSVPAILSCYSRTVYPGVLLDR